MTTKQPIEDRLRASIKFSAFQGNSMERDVCGNQMREAAEEITRLRGLVDMATRAIGDHNAPNDCYATGPMTGDPIQDLVVCPACAYLKARKG